ncbi:complement factor H-related protein 5-like [Garra rufa]|uniref:complement factor H-related protein 5-like n=1 Tax=Garra rufa TaxID=137080 RepID=UPI003CCE801B
MKSSLAFLCLWICFIVDVSRSNGCSEIPEVEHAVVSESSKKNTYSDGDRLEYNCILGHASPIKIIYTCSNNRWMKWRGDKCSLKRCESPEDIPNGRYSIESGRSFVFGTIIKYICNEGYQMMSRFDTRTCRDGGWDNQLPACEEASCERKTPEGNIKVEGLPDSPEDLIRYGHRLTFSCVGSGLMLKGQKEITCQSNGQWSSPFPTCVEAECPLQRSRTEDLKIYGLPDIEGPVKPGHRLTFSCTREGMGLNGPRQIICKSDGTWSNPFPKCEDIACEAEELINVDILIGHPGTAPPYKPGHILVFHCSNVHLKMHGQRTIECLSNGKWDYSYPRCEEVTCEAEQLINVDFLIGHPSTAPPYKPGHILVFRCIDVNFKMHGQRTVECLSNGKWDNPYPKCGEIRCEVPHDQHVNRRYEYFGGDMKLGEKRNYYCETGYNKMATEATCTQDGWTPKPLCAVITVTGKCGTPPSMDNADTKDMTKNEYYTGEKVEYICFTKHVLYQRPPFSKYLTCEQGQWSGDIKCLKPCTVTVEIMDERGIELAHADQQKMFARHNEHIGFKCQWGKVSRGAPLRQKCNDGYMDLPHCVPQWK